MRDAHRLRDMIPTMAGSPYCKRLIRRARPTQRCLRRVSLAVALAVCGLFFVVVAAPLGAQQYTFDDAKARYLIELCKHVEWPNGARLEAFDVAVVSTDRATRRAFDRLETSTVKGKPVRFAFHSNASFDASAYALVYLGDKFRSANSRMVDEMVNTLIVVDGDVPRDELMVSLVESAGQVSIKLNRENLIRRGFAPSIALLDFAGTREDLTRELRLKQSRLSTVLSEVESKEQQLRDLDQQLERNASNLVTAREALASSEKEVQSTRLRLQSFTDDIDRARREMDAFRIQLAEQQGQFESKQAELAVKEHSIAEKVQVIAGLEADIVKSRAVLEQQLEEIDQQRSQLERKNETISAQREGMLAISVALLVFLLLAFFLMRMNRMRTKANLELEKLNSRLYELATTDSLSGLFNRMQFMNAANDAFQYHQSVRTDMSMLMMDIDNFKQVNDEYGHAAGDAVIKAVAVCLSSSLREFDLLGRLGGEEYAMMLVGCDLDAAIRVAKRLCADVEKLRIEHQGQSLGVKISIGVAQMSLREPDIERALSQADKALYQAKDRGRNQVVEFEPD